ncbi:probable insertion sequence transposase protein [alpha proteobacterium BAL199]|nr:probable insertion sequence transposase protein [alpha proteobacterium BAL199]
MAAMTDATAVLEACELPDDPAALKALLITERSLRAELGAEVVRLSAIVAAFKRALFGRRSEKYDPEQLDLALEDVEQEFGEQRAEADAGDPALKTERARRRRANRGSLPRHLPRVEVVVEPDSRTCGCCGEALQAIGEDVSERLDVIPAQFRVIVTRRPKYACRGCAEGVVQAAAPERLIAGGLPTEAMVAHVLVAKYADHTPLYRQAQIYARQGIALDRSTLADWVGHAARELRPVHARLIEIMKASAVVFADETRAPVLDPGRGRTKEGWLWALARDPRPWGGADPPAVAYRYAPGRGAEHAEVHLDGFKGILQVDGYAAYRRLAGPTLAFCWSHARRKFYEIAEAGHAPVAEEALRRIAALYAVEAEIRGSDPQTRHAERQARSRPLVEDLRPWLEAQLSRLSGKSRLAEAIRYTLKLWDGLSRFLDDGRIELDTNTVERAIRPIALNRKNALFAGSDGGGEHWAVIASLVETCKLNDLNPHTYLTDVLERLVAGHQQSRIDDLMPWAYRANADV